MSDLLTFSFSRSGLPKKGTIVAFCGAKGALSQSASELDAEGAISKAIKAAEFKGSGMKHIDIWTPQGTALDRVVLFGVEDAGALSERDWMELGGKIGAATSSAARVSVMADFPIAPKSSDNAQTDAAAKDLVGMALGMTLGAYRFDRYKSSKDEKGKKKDDKSTKYTLVGKGATAARNLWPQTAGVGDGVMFARDLVNEPANVLTPAEFADRAKDLERLGVKVQLLGEAELRRLKMGALLGVSQGSENPPRVAIMEWNGGKPKSAPIAFIGKGVTFDTGGISLKPAGGMEDMKGDMGGAAAVAGLMHALAARKARANVIGIIGLVENMPDGKAQRPGDVVTSMSGQTIEVINTDAEGRLVLCDLLWHCKEKYNPKFMINLATLTGAIMVALGHHRAGLFCNDDGLAGQIFAAGEVTGDLVWRMPLGKEYDKLIDSKVADMKNVGGRMAGSVTAAQFLKRFVDDVPWAHLDIAGTAMGSPKSAINTGWSSGFGVRLLDRLVKDNFEK
ncbi:MAG: leucyl aminopeptidase [Pseudomonadota bacterium]